MVSLLRSFISLMPYGPLFRSLVVISNHHDLVGWLPFHLFICFLVEPREPFAARSGNPTVPLLEDSFYKGFGRRLLRPLKSPRNEVDSRPVEMWAFSWISPKNFRGIQREFNHRRKRDQSCKISIIQFQILERF